MLDRINQTARIIKDAPPYRYVIIKYNYDTQIKRIISSSATKKYNYKYYLGAK